MVIPIEEKLLNANITYRLIQLDEKIVAHSESHLHTLGIDPNDDCKTLIARGKNDNVYALATTEGQLVMRQTFLMQLELFVLQVHGDGHISLLRLLRTE